MITPIILFLSALPPNYVEERVSKMERCVFSGTVIEINTERLQDECFYSSNSLYVLGDTGILKVNTRIFNSLCFIDSLSVMYGLRNFPKIGDKVDFLLGDGIAISSRKIGEGEYIIDGSLLGNISEGNFTPCKPNVPKEEELEIRKSGLNSYLPELYNKKPRTAKKLLTTLEDLNLSIYSQETNILVLYAREILKMLIGIL